MNDEKLSTMRHSLAHIMAAAVVRLWPEAKLGVGPAVEDGFYYDFDLGDVKISESDFKKIEKEMRHIINQKQDFVRSEKNIDEAIEWAKKTKQPYKLELLTDLKEKGTTAVDGANGNKADKAVFYTNGDFTDLCRGPHVANTGDVGVFKLMRVAGAYWRGDEKNPQMQRLYGVAFETQEELDAYLLRFEEAKKRDHRKLGKELDLFTFSDLVGAGLPMFTPRGTILRDKLAEYSVSLRKKAGFELVWTPHITKTDLYKTSGHWDKFGEELFIVQSQVTSDQFALKPMNCPHHTQIFASRPRTYRDMPVRYMEVTTDYRDEKTGELGGLNRVRSLTQDDSHVFCRKDQISDEIRNLVSIVKELYETLGMSDMRAELSYRDSQDKYLGDKSLWDMAQAQIKEAAIENGLNYFEQEGEAAFYGPKIDFLAKDAIGREHQLATIQLDFVQPGRFGLEYTNENGEMDTPVMIHHATLGSIERFLSVYIEHTAGKFPVWCAPEQLRVILVNDSDEITKFAGDVVTLAKENGVRVTLDDSNNSVGKKIRNAETAKVPYSVVLGDKEVQSGKLPVRIRSDINNDNGEVTLKSNELIDKIVVEITTCANKSTL
jgi:threonyl-tRNA synthetase